MPSNTRRLLLRPSALALASNAEQRDGLAPSVTLGRASTAKTALYVRFDSSWRERGRVVSGFLLLEPLAGAASSEDVALEVWRVSRAFTGENLSWSAQPGFEPPFARGVGRAAPAAPVRIDVTEILHFLAAHPAEDHGLAVRAAGNAETGITLSTGADGGLPPRLDVYLE
ncbi:MAG: DNRLRE domain-containing protein [Myxococcota bacterium]